MRDLSATLKTAQQAKTIDALVKIVLTRTGQTTRTYTRDRILDKNHPEEPFSQKATIVLDNSDGALTALALQGYKGVISYGAVTGVGEEYSACAPLWVIGQQLESTPGKLDCTLELIGIFNLMAEDKASESYLPDKDDTKTVKALINEILGATLACFSHCQAYEVVWEDGYDSLADTYKPKDSFRIYVGGSRLAAFRRALDYTGNVARVEADGKIHILKPTVSGVVYASQYSLESGHTFFSKAYRKRVVIPGYIVVKSQPDDDPQYSGYAKDPDYDSLPAELKKRDYKQMRLESDGQADDIAAAILSKHQLWSEMGAADVPMNVGAEVFDYVKVTDARENDYRVGNIGHLTRHYNAYEAEWRMPFSFGNWMTVRKALAGLGVLDPDELSEYFSRLMVKDLYAENILAENVNFAWIDPDNTIDLSKIGDNLDNLPDGETYARVKTLHLDAGQVKLDEHILYKDGYDPNTKRRNFTSTPTTPYDLGDMWTDGTVLKRCTTARATGAYVAGDWTQVSIDEIKDGTIYRRAKSAALTADGLVILDNAVEGTYGLVRSTDISAGHIRLVTCEGDLDDIVNGYYYGKVRQTQLDAGYLKLTYGTVKDDEWYNESGVEIDARHGINLYGEDQALTTRATKTGTIQCKVDSSGRIVAGAGAVELDANGINIFGKANALTTRATRTGTVQCYVGSDGKIYAGAGAVSLDSYGITLTGEKIRFFYGATEVGRLRPDSDGLSLVPIGASRGILLWNFVDLPRRTSHPPAAEGRLYLNTSDNNIYCYVNGAWQTLHNY